MEKKQNKFVLAIIVIAVVINLVTVVMIPFENSSVQSLALSVIAAVVDVAVLYYVLFGYKKPHGNLLRYVMLLFVLSLGIKLVIISGEFSTFECALFVATALLIPYIAGRLNKIEQNKVLIPLALILFIIGAVSYCVNNKAQTFNDLFRICGESIEWFAISAAYFIRYKEHKEAGLSDASKQ